MRLLGRDQGLKIVLEGACLDPEVAAQVGYVDGVVAPDELLDQAVARADRLGRRLKFAVAAVKRAAYIGGSLASRPAGYPAFVMARPQKFDVGLLRSRWRSVNRGQNASRITAWNYHAALRVWFAATRGRQDRT